jgi:hypothetical protein
MINEREHTNGPQALVDVLDPFAIAAGLLKNDVFIVLPAFIILALSALIPGLLEGSGGAYVGALMLFDRFLQLSIMSLIVLRWRKRFEHTKKPSQGTSRVCLRLILVGFIVWGALTFPILGATLTPLPWLASLCLLVFFLALFWIFRFYFYFATFGLLTGSVRELAAATLALSRRNPGAALRSLIAPLAVTALVWGLLLYPSPDGRSIFWSTMTSTALGIFWILATYTGIAYALVLIDESAWRGSGLDPYRKERLRTLETQGRSSHFNWLAPRNGAKIFMVAMCVVALSLFQGLQAAPAPHITVQGCEAQNHGVSVVLELTDVQYKFRGFNPYAFSLRSQTGFDISTGVARVFYEPGGDEVTGPLPSEPNPVKLRVNFKSNKTQEALAALDNVYLWYNLKPLFPVTLRPENPQK